MISFSDYYPFGSIMPMRSSSLDKYRYGFNGQEKENSVNGSYSTTSAEFWMYDGRLGRRWDRDPLYKYFPGISPYSTFFNNPISLCDPLGLSPGNPPTNPEDGQTWEQNNSYGKTTYTYNQKEGLWQITNIELNEIDVNSTPETPKGRAHRLISEFEMNQQTSSVFRNVSKEKIISDLRARVNSGGNEITQSENTCGIAAVCKVFAEYDPEGYVKFTLDLYQKGSASHNNYSVGASEDVAYWAMDAKAMRNTDGTYMDGADLVLIGGLRYAENSFFGFDDKWYQSFTVPGTIDELTENLVGLKTIYANANIRFKPKKADELMRQNEVVYAIYLYPIGFFSYHYQVFGGFDPSDPSRILYWDYGKSTYYTRPMSEIIGFGSHFWILIPK